MSEEINLETSNLCTTEDAFENFQASSMYEEDEYITLSDIAPQEEPLASGLPSDMMEIPYDNEVVLTSNQEDQLCDVNSQLVEKDEIEDIELPLEDFPNTECNEATPQDFSSTECNEATPQQPPMDEDQTQSLVARPKRGRKKKNTGIDNNIGYAERSVTQENENIVSSTSRLQTRRGRKPNQNYNNASWSQSDNSLEQTTIPTEPSQNLGKRSTGRRGRQKKTPLEETATNNKSQQPNGENKTSSQISHDLDNEDVSLNNLRKRPGRLGRRKQILPKQAPENDILFTENEGRPSENDIASTENAASDDLAGFSENVSSLLNEESQTYPSKRGRAAKSSAQKISSDGEHADMVQANSTENNNVSPNKRKKTKGKRGRQKKLKYEEMTVSSSEQDINIEDKKTVETHCQEDDEGDEISLSNLKKTLTSSSNIEQNDIRMDEPESDAMLDVEAIDNNEAATPTKRHPKRPAMPDFEYNVDKVLDDQTVKLETESGLISDKHDSFDSYLVEDTSKRPIRRKITQNLHYDEESDEDPFANVELSDDEPRSRRKGKRYNSDDEYVPGLDDYYIKGGKRRKKNSSSGISDSDLDVEDLEEDIKSKRKRIRNNGSQSKSPRKRGKKTEEQETKAPDVTTITPEVDGTEDDIEVCLQSSVIKATDAQKKGIFSEFEDFIAQKIHGGDLKIKKVSAAEPSQSVPLEIPMIDQSKAKKFVEISTQTTTVKKSATGVQTSSFVEVPMKENITLSAVQSEKACEFLKSVVKTTSELGQLMTQKSEDFITKKINTSHVTDTFKMDYCVKKSFLLFKLAKHNLVQMEEDLARQYEEFLKSNGLQACIEEPKIIEPKPKTADNDSDCEIVETPQTPLVKQEKPKFNPKTVFLNKELSIKIAKKPTITEEKTPKLNIKSRHTVWINDSVMVKKVKPTQSFLAQDSRNKKPPDSYVTEEMVSHFFKQYNRAQVLSACAPFISTEWIDGSGDYLCCYSFVNDKMSDSGTSFPSSSEHFSNDRGSNSASNIDDFEQNSATDQNNAVDVKSNSKMNKVPQTLFSLCTKALQKKINLPNSFKETCPNLSNTIADLKQEERPASLFRLCINKLLNTPDIPDDCSSNVTIIATQNITSLEILPLKTLSFRKVINLIPVITILNEQETNSDLLTTNNETSLFDNNNIDILCVKNRRDNTIEEYQVTQNGLKTLFSMCVELIQTKLQTRASLQNETKLNQVFPIRGSSFTPDCLWKIAFKNVKKYLYNDKCNDLHPNGNYTLPTKTCIYKVKRLADICFQIICKMTGCEDNETIDKTQVELSINSVNTLSEEAFHNIEEPCSDTEENSQYLTDEATFYNDDEFDADFNEFEDDNQTEDNNWVSQVQMKELKSCFDPNRSNNEKQTQHINEETEQIAIPSEDPVAAHIKIEPLEEISENIVDSSIVKAEPVNESTNNLDQMIVIPDSVITKRENTEETIKDPLLRHNSSSFDVDTFESFVRSNKMMHTVNELSNNSDDIFSQSALRVRRQYDPDSDTENCEYDPSMSLLVPQTFEPLNIETAKDRLMESSSDDDSDKKTKEKKKPDRRARGRPKKTDMKPTTKDVNTSKQKEKIPPMPPVSEVVRLTRRMQDRIRQEEKKVQSSDSDNEEVPLNKRKEKDRKENINSKSKNSKTEEEIQCNNVDSTEQIENTGDKTSESFTGFTAVDQNETSNYEKYVKFVYDKILPKVTSEEENQTQDSGKTGNNNEFSTIFNEDNRSSSPLINFDEPAELLECTPTMPMFNSVDSKPSKKSQNKTKTKDKVEQTKPEVPESIRPSYTERNGWKCYPINSEDTKLYQSTAIILEKLPETFVQTYFRYQNITEQSREDHEVDRLINLQSLNRPINVKDVKVKAKGKKKAAPDEQSLGQIPEASRPVSPANSENYDELTPSEDEHNVDDEVPPPAPKPHTENNLAKNSLMDENSDSDTPISEIKTEPNDGSNDTNPRSKRKSKVSPKKPEEHVPENPDNLMLTADKMMNKELNLLHAPVVLKDEIPETTSKATGSKRHRSGGKRDSARDYVKAEDDSSSEEEKQWVNTKEKLLKRMGKKQDTTSIDDAKRAKLVSEFIERRSDACERKRGRGRGRRMSRKKLLEREKQLRVLSRELNGEPSGRGGAAASHSYFKGRRNIRKVIDKKSLARSTVIANMEEFERKCRLNQRQSRLRQLLGCEEGVNVLVINNEVCLEYDFEEQQPIVSVHPFFTGVMKAHQYEGVKFMWDACFETLEKIESGHPGGGCILAHCMGLGKTLQVLALLHTVLTHPRVGMQRVLVCCPLSTVLNWVDEIHKWIGPVTNEIKVFELSKLKKTYQRAYQLEDWYNGGGIFIIGYELFRSLTTLDPLLDDVRPTIIQKIRNALLDPGPDIIVCDEGHLLKNDCSVLAVAMSRVATKRRIVLTGTPMQNNLREYYCMVNFIKPNLLGTYSEYSNRFENPIMNGQHRDSSEEDIVLMKQRTHILHKVLEGCLQRQEASVLYPYLPKKHEYTVFISLTKCQWDLYKHYLQNYASKGSKQSILKDFHILQKIWSHPQVLHNFQMRTRDVDGNKIKPEKLEDDLATEDLTASEDIKSSDTEIWWLQYLDDGKMLDCLNSSNKFVAVFKILDECVKLGDKVLIFSTSLITMDSLEFFLKKINKWSLGQEYYRLDGSVPAEVRQKWCREFNAENNIKTKLFLISTRAGSLGLNMVAANRVIILDTSWNPAHDIQSIFRVYRFGQKKDCYIYRLVAMGTMEQKIYERSVTKQAVACRVVDEQQIDRHYNMAELTELYRYDETGVTVAGGVAVGVTDVALLRVARDASLHAVHEHDSLLRGSSEQGLNEYERAAAWMQFQQEHAHKQMQNKLVPSFALQMSNGLNLQIPTSSITLQMPAKRPLDHEYTVAAPPVAVQTEDETKNTEVVHKPGPKGKKGRKAIVKCRIPVRKEDTPQIPEPPVKVEPPSEPEPLPVNDKTVNKVMNLLIKHNFAMNPSPREISELVSNVRKIVQYGQIPDGIFNKELTDDIVKVLLGKDRPMPALTDIAQEPSHLKERPRTYKGKRGRPKKQQTTAQQLPSTSKAVDNTEVTETDLRTTRRKAALVAGKTFNSMTSESVVDLDGDDDWQNESPESPPEIVPDKTPNVRNKDKNCTITLNEFQRQLDMEREAYNKATKELGQAETEKQSNSVISSEPVVKQEFPSKKRSAKQLQTELTSILLSDDDEPAQEKQLKEPKKEKELVIKRPEKKTDEEIVPLHPSLLSNENFIKIVAHTYLESNQMEEDAAILAAEYSTQKALKEIETTGQSIVSGPIYEIAIKVLGIDILKKLHKTNPQPKKDVKKDAKPTAVEKPAVKTEPVAKEPTAMPKSDAKPATRPRVKAKGISELTMPQPSVEREMQQHLQPIGNTMTKFKVTSSQGISTAPSVVPVGLFKRAVNITPDEPEESILPDDDEVHVISDPVPVPVTPTPTGFGRRNAKPIVLNNLLSKGLTSPAMNTIEISSGRVIMPQSMSTANTMNVQSVQTPIPTETIVPTQNDTICLDSDDEDNSAEQQPTKCFVKRVAMKSTAKKQPRVVPVSLTAANPQLNQILPQPTPAFDLNATQTPQLQPSVMNLNPMQQLPPNKNYLVIPASQIKVSKIPTSSVPPVVQGIAQAGMNLNQTTSQNATVFTHTSHNLINTMPRNMMNNMPQVTMIPQYRDNTIPQNINLMTSMPQNVSMMSSLPQNMNLINSAPQISAVPMNLYSHMNTIPQMNLSSIPQMNINTMHPQINMNTIAQMSPVPQSTNSESILPITNDPQHAKSKTVCKPGDILRITKTGQVEILNRSENKEVSEDDSTPSKSSTTKRKTVAVMSKRISKSSEVPSKAANEVMSLDDDDEEVAQMATRKQPLRSFTKESTSKKIKSTRIRASSSSSSSSSDSSRPASPEDPLAILKDVVHIRAADDVCDNSKTRSGTSQQKSDDNIAAIKNKIIGNTSITKRNLTPSKAVPETPSKQNVTITSSKDKVTKQITKTGSILKKLDNVLGPSKKHGICVIEDSVDLTDFDNDSTSKADNVLSKLSKNILVGKTVNKPQPPTKAQPSKTISTAKNFIIPGTGKGATTSSDSSGKKSIRVTNVEKIVPASTSHKPRSDALKRPSASVDSSALKKKKTEPMTLKDFDIDDIDDIIELE